MSTEKPLHVQVAEALGQVECGAWKLWGQSLGGPEWMKPNGSCKHENCYPPGLPPRYDLHWPATGPLIERYGLALDNEPIEEDRFGWRAQERYWQDSDTCALHAFGPTPLIAVCNLILALKAAGKLAE